LTPAVSPDTINPLIGDRHEEAHLVFRKRRPDDKPGRKNPKTGIILVKDGVQREVTFEELALSNTLSLEALVRVLARAGSIDPKELLEEMEKVKSERFRGGSELPDVGLDTAH
jgi:hypothetical protein